MNIVFDLGGVVFRWEPAVVVAKLIEDPALHDIVLEQVVHNEDWLDLDRGKLTIEETVVRTEKSCGLPAEVVRNFFHGIPGELTRIPGTVELMRQLRDHGHALYCLSNMPTATMAHLERVNDFWDVFTGMVISSRVGLCKPEPAIYAHLIETHRLEPAQTVFIDDLETNLAAAEKFGIRTIRFVDAEQCERDLQTLLSSVR